MMNHWQIQSYTSGEERFLEIRELVPGKDPHYRKAREFLEEGLGRRILEDGAPVLYSAEHEGEVVGATKLQQYPGQERLEDALLDPLIARPYRIHRMSGLFVEPSWRKGADTHVFDTKGTSLADYLTQLKIEKAFELGADVLFGIMRPTVQGIYNRRHSLFVPYARILLNEAEKTLYLGTREGLQEDIPQIVNEYRLERPRKAGLQILKLHPF